MSSTKIPSIYFGSSKRHKSLFFQINPIICKCILAFVSVFLLSERLLSTLAFPFGSDSIRVCFSFSSKEQKCEEDDSGEKSPRRFFRWFWDFLKEEKVFLPVFFFTQKVYTKLCFQMQSTFSVSTDLLSFITKISLKCPMPKRGFTKI